jgi:hypothetical protein
MQVNKIDELIDNTLNTFYAKIILNDTTIEKIFNEPNFVKYQSDINNILLTFTDNIDIEIIKNLVQNNDAIYTIKESIKRYISIYLFLFIGINYSSKEETYVNNIVEFTKNQGLYKYKVKNYFNSESNAILIKYNLLIKDIIHILSIDKLKIEAIKHKKNIIEALNFLNDLGEEYINKYFVIKNEKNINNLTKHNIIKTLILLLLYKQHEKKEFFRILEMAESSTGEYIYIDIVVPSQNTVDYSSVLDFLGNKKMASDYWEFLTNVDKETYELPLTHDEKILKIIKSKLLVPISDEFLLYHKDTEKYDSPQDNIQIKKKENTKIKYIVNKVNFASELYSEQIKKNESAKFSIKKLFYGPLNNRKGVTINYYNDINIINKFVNQTNLSTENIEYLNDLLHFRSYPYINFKEFENDGFPLMFDSTIDVVRSVSFEKTGDFKQNSTHKLQMRIGSKNMLINIVGFVIPPTNIHLKCTRINNSIDIRSLTDKNKNGINLVIKYLQESNMNTKNHNSSIYWIFNNEQDIITGNTYEQVTKFTKSDQLKHTISILYDNIIFEMVKYFDKLIKQHKNITLQEAFAILAEYEKQYMPFPRASQEFAEIEKIIYENVIKIEQKYDKSDDIVHGFYDDAIKLPTINKIKKSRAALINIDLKEIVDTVKKEIIEDVKYLCQHNVEWEKLSTKQRTNPSAYTDNIHYFIQQYVTESSNGEYICKSCGFLLNMKKYLADGIFDNESKKFVSFTMPLDIPLEDIPEYEKFKLSIRNIDKLVEKISLINNIPHLIKGASEVKWKRKSIVKDTIDIIQLNYNELRQNYKERRSNISKMYDINEKYTNLFVFPLENSIFVFSSKDKDTWKAIKQNNILMYMVILLLLEVNDSHVTYIGEKKGLCTFTVFDKIIYNLFDNLKIRINTKGDVAPITNYKILCYELYIICCTMIRYKMWHYDYPEGVNHIKLLPQVQKTFLHTFVDILNSILEIATKPSVHYLYEMLSVKIFQKMNTTFKNNDLYDRLKILNTIKISERKSILENKRPDVYLSGNYIPITYNQAYRQTCRIGRKYMNKLEININKNTSITNITNCLDGKFHSWKLQKDVLVCKHCKVNALNNKLNEKDTEIIRKNYQLYAEEKMLKALCPNCEYVKEDIIGSLNTKKIKITKKINDYIKHITEQNEIYKENTRKIKTEVVALSIKYESDIKSKYITDFINLIKENVNSQKNILFDDQYIITHDHFGITLPSPHIINNTQNKIIYKTDHPFFKTDVLYYVSTKNGKIEIYYDAISKVLLGYKEESKNFVYSKINDKYLIIEYSIFSQLKLMGFTQNIINVEKRYNELEELGLNQKMINKKIIQEIINTRINNLKRFIVDAQKIIQSIISNIQPKITEEDENYFSNISNTLIQTYNKIKIQNVDNLFEDWQIIVPNIRNNHISNNELIFDFTKVKNINAKEINKIDTSGELLLKYIIDGFTKLLLNNKNNDLEMFFISFIKMEFSKFNNVYMESNIDIKRFNYILSSTTFLEEITEQSGIKNIEGIYSEYIDNEELTKEEIEKRDYDKEEADALDVDEDLNENFYEGNYDRIEEVEFNEGKVYNPIFV